MTNVVSYIDESGDSSLCLEKNGVTRYFVVTAILIEQTNIDSFKQGVSTLRSKFFSGSELKSSSLGSIKRRTDLIAAINGLDFRAYSIAVDKAEVSKHSGLIYKKPFLKYINGLLYKRLFKAHPDLVVFCDQHGYPEFQQSFKKYIETQHRPNLFSTCSVTPVDSKDHEGVQVADIIAGSIRHCLESKNKELIQLIRSNCIGIEVWPPRKGYISLEQVVSNDFDEVVEQYCMNQVKTFLERNISSNNDDKRLQVSVLEYLLSRYYGDNEYSHCITKSIIKGIDYDTGDKSEYYFRTKIIGGLRDEGVIIASSTKGLKIPTSVKDLGGYVDESFKKILPMMQRLDHARKQIKLATLDKLDILEGKDKERQLIDFMDSCNLLQ